MMAARLHAKLKMDSTVGKQPPLQSLTDKTLTKVPLNVLKYVVISMVIMELSHAKMETLLTTTVVAHLVMWKKDFIAIKHQPMLSQHAWSSVETGMTLIPILVMTVTS
jgi:hypothetical protein